MICVTSICESKLLGKTCSLFLVTIYNFSFVPFFFLLFSSIPNHWGWGVLFASGLRGFLEGSCYTWFIVFIFELIFSSINSKELLRSWFVDWTNVLNHLIIPRNQQNVTRFCYIWWWIRLLLDNCLMILAWPQRPYNWYYCCFVCINPWWILLL